MIKVFLKWLLGKKLIVKKRETIYDLTLIQFIENNTPCQCRCCGSKLSSWYRDMIVCGGCWERKCMSGQWDDGSRHKDLMKWLDEGNLMYEDMGKLVERWKIMEKGEIVCQKRKL